MLVLTRKSEESVIVGTNIEVRVLGIRGDQVSLGFTAPQEISIYRKEVYEAIQQENLLAVNRSNDPTNWLRSLVGKTVTLNTNNERGDADTSPQPDEQ